MKIPIIGVLALVVIMFQAPKPNVNDIRAEAISTALTEAKASYLQSGAGTTAVFKPAAKQAEDLKMALKARDLAKARPLIKALDDSLVKLSTEMSVAFNNHLTPTAANPDVHENQVMAYQGRVLTALAEAHNKLAEINPAIAAKAKLSNWRCKDVAKKKVIADMKQCRGRGMAVEVVK